MSDNQTGSITATLAFQQIADATSMDSNLKGILYSKLLAKSALQHNAFSAFTSTVDANSMVGRGVRSIFARKTDLSKGGGQQVYFNVVGPPAGPGAKGTQTLVGRTSPVSMKTFNATVAWHRDAISFSKDMFEFLSAGGTLESTALGMLAEKMGLEEQNHMMMRLRKDATTFNTIRPGNRNSYDALLPEDTLSLDFVVDAKTRLSTIGGKPINQKIGGTGYPIKSFLTFATDNQFRPLRNDDSFQTVQSNADTRGDGNALFSGTLLDWQGMPFYELPSLDMAWDDYQGNALTPKAVLGQAVSRAAANVLPNPDNTSSQYLQFFPGAPYNFDGTATTAIDDEFYVWIINPDGSVGFAAYQDDWTNGANGVTLTKILSTNTTGINEQTVGEVVARTSGTTGGDGTYTPTTGETNLPTGWTYTDQFAVGAVVLPANAKGTTTGFAYILGAMSGCFANGRIEKAMIEQKEDFGFVTAKGYETIMGTCTTLDPLGRNAGYLLVECAVEHEGLPTPLVDL
jgi:N4-gp56 family major capsid protein